MDRQATKEEINDVAISFIMQPESLKEYLTVHNKLIDKVEQLQTEKDNLDDLVANLKAQAKEQSKKKPDVAKLTDARVQEEVVKQAQEFQFEMQALKELIREDEQRIGNLEKEKQELNQLYNTIRNSISQDDIERRDKTQQLEKNMLALQEVFQKVNNDLQLQEVELKNATKKLATKDEKIAKLEEKLSQSKDK